MGVLFIALAGAAPMSAMLGNVPIAVGSGNGTAAPGGFILAAVVLTLFSVGYVAMARQFTTAGGFYGFISHGLGRPLAMAAGWSGMAAYSVFEAGEWGIFAFYTRSTIGQFLHINLPWPFYAFCGLAIVGVLTYFDVKLSARILGVALVCEALLLLIMDLFILGKGGAHGVSFTPLEPDRSLEWRQHQGRGPRGGDLLRPVVLGRFRMHGQLCRRGSQPAQDGPKGHLHRSAQPRRAVHAHCLVGRARSWSQERGKRRLLAMPERSSSV